MAWFMFGDEKIDELIEKCFPNKEMEFGRNHNHVLVGSIYLRFPIRIYEAREMTEEQFKEYVKEQFKKYFWNLKG